MNLQTRQICHCLYCIYYIMFVVWKNIRKGFRNIQYSISCLLLNPDVSVSVFV